jgi:LacI family transcriptional regulator
MDKLQTITIFDIAQASGVSYSTVSRVLNGFEFVKADTRQRVLKVAEDLGYVANLQARSLAGGKSKIIGVLVPSLENGYISAIAQGIDEELTKAGYDLMLYTTHHKQGKEAQYAKTIASGLTDGLLLMVPLIPSSQLESNYLTALRQKGFPYVLIDQTDAANQSTVVDSNNRQGAYEATTYLVGLGHKRIGFIMGHMEINAARERLEGYKTALKENNLTFEKSLIVKGDFTQRAGYEAAKELLQLRQPPTAIFSPNDLAAFGVMEAIREAGLRIPEDMSVIGFDDLPQASLTYPKLTTVRQPLQEMGRIAVKLLLEQIEQPNRATQHVTLETQLVKRDSCKSIEGTL